MASNVFRCTTASFVNFWIASESPKASSYVVNWQNISWGTSINLNPYEVPTCNLESHEPRASEDRVRYLARLPFSETCFKVNQSRISLQNDYSFLTGVTHLSPSRASLTLAIVIPSTNAAGISQLLCRSTWWFSPSFLFD